METWLIIGAGRCGLQLAAALARHRALAGVVCRSEASKRQALAALPSSLVFSWDRALPAGSQLLLAVRDRELPSLLPTLAERGVSPPVALHTSGSQSPEVLAPLRELGTAVGLFHPLLPFPHPQRPRLQLRGAYVTLAGDPQAVHSAQALAKRLGLRPMVVAQLDWPLYHAAATLAGPMLYTLLLVARHELLRAGFPAGAAAEALHHLAAAVIQQLRGARGWERLTGPLARGDEATVAAHLAVLAPAAQQAYRALAQLARSQLFS